MDSSAPLLGVFESSSEFGIYVLTNRKSYRTELEFMLKERVGELIDCLKSGDKIRYFNNKVSRYDFANCTFCHKSQEADCLHCDCNNAENAISALGKVTSIEVKPQYMKAPPDVVLNLEYEGVLNPEHEAGKTLAFICSNMYPIIEPFVTEGDLIYYKGFVISEGEYGRIVNIFHMEVIGHLDIS